nr:unnamed protein product [Callosobruchus analis]
MERDTGEEAKEALVFMLVAFNDHWKIPVGYFLMSKLNASEKANLLGNCLEFIDESGVEVVSVTFDGCPTNFAMCNILGANLKNVTDLKNYIDHPITKKHVYIFLESCHMFKLIMDYFARLKQIIDSDGRLINWEFLEKLCSFQESEGVHLANRLRRRHLLWDHIEIFFSAVRSRGGFTNNPTSRQFQATMKKLLFPQKITGSENANDVATRPYANFARLKRVAKL